MRVLMIEHFLPGSTYTMELCKELQELSDITLLCPTTVKRLPQIHNYRSVLYAGGKGKMAAMVTYIHSLFILFKELMKPYDIVHIQTLKAIHIEMPLYKMAKKLRGKHTWRLVYTVHNVLPHERMKNEIQRFSRIYNLCDALIVHNEFCKQLLVDEYNIPEEKISVIPHGTYSDLAKLPEIKRIGYTIFLFFGAIKEYKGLDVLLKAIKTIPQEIRNNLCFIIAGNPKYADINYKDMAAKLEIEENINWIYQAVNYEDLPRLFQYADACVFPYKEIYGSGALMMAYTFNIPVIVSNLPAFVEETDNGRTGILFQTEDPESLAKQIVRFSELPKEQISDYKAHIQHLVSIKYNWALSARKTKALYDSLCLHQ